MIFFARSHRPSRRRRGPLRGLARQPARVRVVVGRQLSRRLCCFRERPNALQRRIAACGVRAAQYNKKGSSNWMEGAMRSITMVAFAVLTIGLATAASQAEQRRTVKDFLASCAEISPADAKSMEPSAASLHCAGILTQSEAAGRAAHKICLPGPISLNNLRLNVVRWLGSHPQMSDASEENGVYAALEDLYPCR